MTVVEGISICFQRVSQSYTARVVKAVQSQSLGQHFITMTEECFGKTLNLLEIAGPMQDGKALDYLNRLSADVHRFHQQLETSLTQGLVNTVSFSRSFEALERNRDQIVEEINAHRSSLQNFAKKSYWAILVSALLFFLGLMVNLLGVWRKRQRKGVLKNLAKKTILPVQGEARIPKQVVEVGALLNSLIDFLSSKLFAGGIALKLKSQKSRVHAYSESLEQALYRLFMGFMGPEGDNNFCKSITVEVERLEKQTFISLVFMRRKSYDMALLQGFSLEHTLTAALVKHCGGELLLENIVDGKLCVGVRIRITLQNATSPFKRRFPSQRKEISAIS